MWKNVAQNELLLYHEIQNSYVLQNPKWNILGLWDLIVCFILFSNIVLDY